MPGSSPEFNDSVQAEAQDSDVSTTEVSSTSEKQGDKSLLETVQAALEEGVKETSPGSEPEPNTTESLKADAPVNSEDEPLGDITDEELKRYAPKTQRRIQQLLQDRRSLEEKVTIASEKASRFDQIVGFAESNQLSNEDVAETFAIAALLKNDPMSAYEKVLPIFLHLSQVTGNVLPSDMQEKVNLGYLPEQDARELIRTKNQNAILQAQFEARQQQEQQAKQANSWQAVVDDCKNATAEWEQKRSQTDPDWSSKKELVIEFVHAEIAKKGFPAGRAQMIEVLNSASSRVDSQVARFRPSPRAINPVTGNSSARATAEPTTAVEAAMMALGAAR